MNPVTPFTPETFGAQFTKREEKGYTVISTEAKSLGGYNSLLIETSSDGKYLKIGTVGQIPGESQSKNAPHFIPIREIGPNGIKVEGSHITLGNISFIQFDAENNPLRDESTGADKIDPAKHVVLQGTDGNDIHVIDGDVSKTKVVVIQGKGDDTLVNERSAIGTIELDSGEGNDLNSNINGSQVKVVRPAAATLDSVPETIEGINEFEYIKIK